MIHPDPRVDALLLTDLGHKVVAAIVTTMTLGHTRLAHSATYGDVSADPGASLVRAVIDGEIDRARTALERWAADESERWCQYVERATGESLPRVKPTALEIQAAVMDAAFAHMRAGDAA